MSEFLGQTGTELFYAHVYTLVYRHGTEVRRNVYTHKFTHMHTYLHMCRYAGTRTLIEIELLQPSVARDIRDFSLFPQENEVCIDVYRHA